MKVCLINAPAPVSLLFRVLSFHLLIFNHLSIFIYISSIKKDISSIG